MALYEPCRYTVTGGHAGRASAAAATVLSVRRADTDTVPEGGYHTARRLPRVDPGRLGGGAGPRERLQRRPRVRHHPVRRTSGPATRSVADIGQVRRDAKFPRVSGCVVFNLKRLSTRVFWTESYLEIRRAKGTEMPPCVGERNDTEGLLFPDPKS